MKVLTSKFPQIIYHLLCLGMTYVSISFFEELSNWTPSVDFVDSEYMSTGKRTHVKRYTMRRSTVQAIDGLKIS